MMSLTNYTRFPLLVALLFGTAQPSPNFFACTVRIHDVAEARTREHRYCNEAEPCTSQRNDRNHESIKARLYLPCCQSVVQYGSVSEHRRTNVPTIIHLILHLPNQKPSVGSLRILDRSLTPSPKTLGNEILNLNLRI